MDPATLNKYLYIEKTATWRVRAFYSFGLAAWFLVVYSYGRAAMFDPFYRWVGLPIVALFTVYTISSFGLNLFYRRFDLKKHLSLIERYWWLRAEPSVDIFLPICGESMEILQHTWQSVSRLNYRNARVYVLDDSKEECVEHKELAKRYGFTYFERPNKGEMKKAGNLKYGYLNSQGEFIIIFDADFAPHPDFVRELLPHMDDPNVGIVQSPQYFEMTKRVRKRSPLEYGSANIQECFYRFIQVTRDRLGATVCCGTNAIYRRSALDEIGGTVQAGHSEDQRTGFALQSRGWIVRYVPVILAVGLCPDDPHSYFHQQHRWCTGNLELMLSMNFWRAPVSWKAKYCYVTGFLFYLHHIFALAFSFQLFWSLFFYNQYITLANGVLFYPYLIFSIVYLTAFPISRFSWGSVYALFIRNYTYSHSIVATFFNNSVGWIPTGAKHANVSLAFRQVVIAVAVYVLAYLCMIAFAVREGMIHLFNYNYYSVQSWMIYNTTLSIFLLWQLYRTMERAQESALVGVGGKRALLAWQLRTAGAYTGVVTALFLGIAFL